MTAKLEITDTQIIYSETVLPGRSYKAINIADISQVCLSEDHSYNNGGYNYWVISGIGYTYNIDTSRIGNQDGLIKAILAKKSDLIAGQDYKGSFCYLSPTRKK